MTDDDVLLGCYVENEKLFSLVLNISYFISWFIIASEEKGVYFSTQNAVGVKWNVSYAEISFKLPAQ